MSARPQGQREDIKDRIKGLPPTPELEEALKRLDKAIEDLKRTVDELSKKFGTKEEKRG